MPDRFLTLLRHGEVQGGPRFRGHCDHPLEETGWARMRDSAARVLDLDPPPDALIASPARRCADFALWLAESRGLPLRSWRALAERGFGDWEGRRAEEIPPEDLARFWSDPTGFAPRGAEPFADFRARVLGAWLEILASGAAHTLLIAHGGTIRILVAEALGLADPSGLAVEVPPACLTRIRLPEPPGRPSLIAHLA